MRRITITIVGAIAACMLIAGAAEAMILGLPVGVRAAATETAVLTPVRWCRVCNRYDGQCSKTWVEGTCWRPYQPYWQPGAVVWGYSYPMFGWAPAPQPRYAPRPYYAPGSYDEPPPGRGYYSRGR